MKTRTINTSLTVVLGYYGLSNSSIYVKLQDDNRDIEIGENIVDKHGDANPVKAINNAIDNLKLMIVRLEKLKLSKSDPMFDEAQDKANKIKKIAV